MCVKGQEEGCTATQQDMEFRVYASGLKVGARVLRGCW